MQALIVCLQLKICCYGSGGSSIDVKTMEAFQMKRQILQIKWQQFVCNEKITATTGLPSTSSNISGRRTAIFGHIALCTKRPAHIDSLMSSQPGAQSTTVASGNILLAAAGGSTRSERIATTLHLSIICRSMEQFHRTSSVYVSVVRYGRRRLRADDDDDDLEFRKS